MDWIMIKLISFIAPEALPPKRAVSMWFSLFDGLDFVVPICLHNKLGQLICELVKDDGETHLLGCFQSGAVSMALCASLPLFPYCYTVGLSTPLSGPPSLPKPSYSLLFLCLVFCLRPSLIRYVGSNFPIYKHLKYLSLWLFLHWCLKEMQNRIQH